MLHNTDMAENACKHKRWENSWVCYLPAWFQFQRETLPQGNNVRNDRAGLAVILCSQQAYMNTHHTYTHMPIHLSLTSHNILTHKHTQTHSHKETHTHTQSKTNSETSVLFPKRVANMINWE